jgi:8-oxo-dGTP diphosphatase
MEHPGVGVAVWVRKNDRILLGKHTTGSGKGMWGTPGGKLELYEDIYDCAHRETKEETGVEIKNLEMVAVANDPARERNAHWVTLFVVADWQANEAKLMEPDKFESWKWFSWDSLPHPLRHAAAHFVELGLNPFSAQPIHSFKRS